MERLIQILTNITKLNKDEILQSALSEKSVQEEIIKLNQRQLFDLGQDSEGRYLGQYSYLTYQEKQAKFGSFPKHITLYDTGDFYKSMKVDNRQKEFEIKANGQKAEDNLFEKYGQNITGLDSENIENIQPILIPLMQKSIINAILR